MRTLRSNGISEQAPTKLLDKLARTVPLNLDVEQTSVTLGMDEEVMNCGTIGMYVGMHDIVVVTGVVEEVGAVLAFSPLNLVMLEK